MHRSEALFAYVRLAIVCVVGSWKDKREREAYKTGENKILGIVIEIFRKHEWKEYKNSSTFLHPIYIVRGKST